MAMQITFESRFSEGPNRIFQYGCRQGKDVCGITLIRVACSECGGIWTLIVCAAAGYQIDEKLVMRIKRRLLPHVPMRGNAADLVITMPNGVGVATLIEAPEMPYVGN